MFGSKTYWLLALCLWLVPTMAEAQGSPRAFLGVRMTQSAAGQVRVTSVLPGSPAERAGLQPGDVLLRVGDRPVSSASEVVAAVSEAGVGRLVPLSIERDSQPLRLEATLERAPSSDEILRRFIGRPAPEWRLDRVDGRGSISLAGLRGRVVVLYFWSVWCGACGMASPALTRLAHDFDSNGVAFLALSSDPPDQIRRARRAAALGFPLLGDVASKVGSSYWVVAVPTFFVIDQSGRVAYSSSGWDRRQESSLRTVISRLVRAGATSRSPARSTRNAGASPP